MEYTPDNWVMLEIKLKSGEVFKKLLCGWSGGYLDGDSWRLSTEPVQQIEEEHAIRFTTQSGKQYVCRKGSQVVRSNCSHILHQLEEHPKVEAVTIMEIEYA